MAVSEQFLQTMICGERGLFLLLSFVVHLPDVGAEQRDRGLVLGRAVVDNVLECLT